MDKSNNKNSRTSNLKKMKTPNYDANQSRIKINKIIEEKNAEKIRRKIKIVFTFIIIGIIICILYLILKLPYFNISSIEVYGNNIYSNEDILNSVSDEIGKNIFIERFFNKVEVKLPYIKSVKLKVKLPNTLKLAVSERTSSYFAYDKENNIYYKLDSNGYILERCDNVSQRTNGEYIISGIGFNKEVELGTKIDDAYVYKLSNFYTIREKLEKSMSNVTITNVNFENSLTTVTLDDKLNVKFSNNNNDINYTISLLKAIIEKLPEGSAGVIDMTKTDPIFSSY